ncbi:hypothetical protein AB0I28_02105 [Phytomonospora sp. NPDC050363]|uniref:hypothetical protein n=1 Tax=Phytomonospora sp. NPDC050363 TaxID=3155642 RepID=UPI0033E6164D
METDDPHRGVDPRERRARRADARVDEAGAEEKPPAPTLLDDFLSKDRRRVLHAVWEVFKTRDPKVLEPLAAALPVIDRATDDVDLGGALMSNGENLTHALDRIRLFGKGRCLCAAYTDHVFYEPRKEVAYGHVRIVEVVEGFYYGRPKRICECADCGQRYEIEEGEYHYPWWKWTVPH